MSFPCSWCHVHVCVYLCLHVLVHFHVKSTWLLEDSQQLKWMGARTADRSAACSDFILTVCMRSMTWGDLACWRSLNTGPPTRLPKMNGGHATGACWAPQQFTRLDEFTAHCCLNQVPVGCHRGRQQARIILVMAWRHWTVCRNSRLGQPGPS